MAKKSVAAVQAAIRELDDFLENQGVADFRDGSTDSRSWKDGVTALIRPGSPAVLALALPVPLSEGSIEALTEAGLVISPKTRVKLNKAEKLAMTIDYSAVERLRVATAQEETRVAFLEKQVKFLKKQLKAKSEENVAECAIAALVEEVTAQVPDFKPGKITMPVRKASGGSAKKPYGGSPVVLLSDWHWGEVVDPRQIGGINEFNLEIAARRSERVFSAIVDLLLRHQSGTRFGGIYVPLLGDMLSGNIHEELQRTNDMPMAPCLFNLVESLVAGIDLLAENFEHVTVPCVVGNHGRMERKPSAKNKAVDNFDYIAYKILEGRYAKDSRVTVQVSEAADLRVDVEGTRLLLTHGDQIRGGDGIGGIWPAMFRTDMRKRKRYSTVGNEYDYLCCGHFHRQGAVDGVILNGSLKGYDEYAYQCNFNAEPPQQTLFVVHPQYGITQMMPLLCEPPAAEFEGKKAA